jgi:hypothetical protein
MTTQSARRVPDLRAANLPLRRFRAAWSSLLTTAALLAAKSGLLAGLPW